MDPRTEHITRRGLSTPPAAAAPALVFVAWGAVALCAGCGRLSFEPVGEPPPDAGVGQDAPPAALQLDDSATDEVVVRIPGELELAFRREHKWQPTRWIDPVFDPGVNLAGDANSASDVAQVLFAPLGIVESGALLTLDDAFNQTISPGQLSPTQVQLITTWTWFTSDAAVLVTASYIIDADGHIDVSVVAVSDRPVFVDEMEYGYVNVNPALPWELSPAADNRQFTIQSAAGPPRPSGLTVTVDTDTAAPLIGSDGEANLHFDDTTPVEIDPDLPLSIRWSAQLAIGDRR